MPVELWIAKEFDTHYEREALDRFMTDMEAYFGQSDILYLVLADYVIDGRQIDLTVLKHDAITIIELKECADPFEAFENQRWLTPSGYALGSRGLNPFQQVKQYRIKWFDVLKRNSHSFRCLTNTHDDRPFWQVRALVAVSPALHPKTKNHISSRHNFWFKLCGLDELAKQMSFETSRWLSFSDDELYYLASELLVLRQRSWSLPVESEWQSIQETGVEVQGNTSEKSGRFKKLIFLMGIVGVSLIILLYLAFNWPAVNRNLRNMIGEPSPTPICGCTENTYDCSDFSTQTQAQDCFDYCITQEKGDIHKLDKNGDGIACESLP